MSLFCGGSLSLDWTGVRGLPGILPRLQIDGKLVGKGYGYGSVVMITADVTSWGIPGSHTYLGTTTPETYVLNCVKQQVGQLNPPTPNETTLDAHVYLPMPPSLIESFEEVRQGKEFELQLDVSFLMVDRGIPLTGTPAPSVHYEIHPTMRKQDRMRISQHDWGEVLKRWDRAASVPLVVPLPETNPHPDRATIVRHLRDAWQKVDGADYSGSIAEARKALELLRKLSPVKRPLPSDVKQRDVDQRHHIAIDALFDLASAPAHTDDPVRDYQPTRSDAVAVVAGTAALAQRLFERLQADP